MCVKCVRVWKEFTSPTRRGSRRRGALAVLARWLCVFVCNTVCACVEGVYLADEEGQQELTGAGQAGCLCVQVLSSFGQPPLLLYCCMC